MRTIYASAVRRTPPGAVIAVDLFHVVQPAVKTVGDVRRRAVRDKYGRRGKSGDPEYGLKNLLVRNLENLTPAQFAKIIETLDADEAWQQIARAWTAKGKLRAALSLRARATGSAPASGRYGTACSPSTTGARRTRSSPSSSASRAPSPDGKTRSSQPS